MACDDHKVCLSTGIADGAQNPLLVSRVNLLHHLSCVARHKHGICKLHSSVFNLWSLLSEISHDLSQFFHLSRIEFVFSLNTQCVDPWSPFRARSCIGRS